VIYGTMLLAFFYSIYVVSFACLVWGTKYLFSLKGLRWFDEDEE
jgi:hypothetical protein